jgi:hypothetical protein
VDLLNLILSQQPVTRTTLRVRRVIHHLDSLRLRGLGRGKISKHAISIRFVPGGRARRSDCGQMSEQIPQRVHNCSSMTGGMVLRCYFLHSKMGIAFFYTNSK